MDQGIRCIRQRLSFLAGSGLVLLALTVWAPRGRYPTPPVVTLPSRQAVTHEQIIVSLKDFASHHVTVRADGEDTMNGVPSVVLSPQMPCLIIMPMPESLTDWLTARCPEHQGEEHNTYAYPAPHSRQ